MALSSRPCAASDGHAAPALAAGGLPEDAIYEILLRLPAKDDLCRLRAVCRPWRSLLSDPAFAAAHAARHPEPLLIVAAGDGYGKNNNGVIFNVMDLSGRVVRQVRRVTDMAGHEQMVSVQGDLTCLAKRSCKSCILLNLATGAVCAALPEELLEEHERRVKVVRPWPYTDFALGQVAATGEYKVLRLIDCFFHPAGMLYEVSTLNGDSHGQWSKTKAPPYDVKLCGWSSVTINGIVYLLPIKFGDFIRDTIAPFNLEAEEWMPSIRGPLSFMMELENVAGLQNDHMDWGVLSVSLAVLNGCLVLSVHIIPSSMDLWFLMDVEKALWVKQHSIKIEISYWLPKHKVRPLLVLNDGRIVLVRMGDRGLLKIYDPRTGTFTDVVETGPCDAIGLYTGNLY